MPLHFEMHLRIRINKNVKCMFLCSAVSSPLDRSKPFLKYNVPSWHTCSFRHQLYFSGKNSAMLHLLCEDNSFTLPAPSKALFSFIRMSELWVRRESDNTQALKRGVEPLLLSIESGIIPLRYQAPQQRLSTLHAIHPTCYPPYRLSTLQAIQYMEP